MQLAQYISTIANGGYRIRPRIVREVRAPLMNNEEFGPVLEEFEPKILSRLKLERKWMENVQEGFRQVMQHWEGTAYKYFGDAHAGQPEKQERRKLIMMVPAGLNLNGLRRSSI